MKAIFDESEASTTAFLNGHELREQLTPSDQEMADACAYLEGEGLIWCQRTLGSLTPFVVRITHKGIREMEQSLRSPEKPTRYLAAASYVVNNFHGDVIGSAVQSASPGARQEVTFSGGLDLGAVNRFLGEYDARASELNLPSPQAEELAADIATVRTQVESPRPKKNIIIESLHSARTILELTAGSAAAVGLLDALKLIHL